jgi:hypothetical protein
MNCILNLPALTILSLAPATTVLTAAAVNGAKPLTPIEAAALSGGGADLGSMRAGGADSPTLLGASERDELRAAATQASFLGDLRAGAMPTDHEWTWLLIGAGVVLLIILL